MRLDTEEYAYPVEFMCERLGVSKSGYYDWRSRPDSATTQRREELKLLIKKAFEMSDSTYGYRRGHAPPARRGGTPRPGLGGPPMPTPGPGACQPHPERWGPPPAPAATLPPPPAPQL